MGERSMLPIQAILNRSPPRPRPGTPNSQPSASELSSPASDVNESFTATMGPRTTPKNRKTRDSSDLSYTRPQGPINYPPHEALDEAAYNQMRPFNVYPFGQISHYCAHIPYSSDKKDVFEKTGRENFNVFVYRFTDPNDRQTYDVMWDYLGGFVRISPFFKSRKHKKTGPAKMLEANKGLRDISFHMTGGNRVAQGYWVPYSCARAVCATFCYPIAGALIPIFGSDFPQDCIKPDSPRYGRMDIDEKIINDAKFSVSAYRHASSSNGLPKPSSVTSHPHSLQDPYSLSMKERLEQYSGRRPHGGPPHTWGPLSTVHLNPPHPPVHTAWRSTPEREIFRASPNASPTWKSINAPKVAESRPPSADPLLSALPRLATEERPRPYWLTEFRRGDQDTLKRYKKGDGALHKRQKVGHGPWRPHGRTETRDRGEAVRPTSPEHHRQAPVVAPNEPIVPIIKERGPLPAPLPKPQQHTEENGVDYTCKEREAAFSLMNMQQRLPDDLDTETRNSNTKRWRARSV